jgi:hypothetical protein
VAGVLDIITIDDAPFASYRTPGGKALRDVI